MNHGIYIKEQASAISAVNQIENITVAIGTAPLANKKPVLAYTFSEFQNQLGYDDDFSNFTLSEVAQAQFNLYGVAPVVFINVFNPENHNKTISQQYEGETEFLIEDEIIDGTLKVTSGEFEEPTTLIAGTDYVCDSMYLHGENEDPVIAIEFLDTSKIQGGKFKVTYRQTSTALGGEATVEDVELEELEDNIWELTDDTIIESVVVETGGVDTFVNLEYILEQDTNGKNLIIVHNPAAIVEGKVDIEYKTPAPENVSADDIIEGINLIDAVYPKWRLIPSILIAPKFSQEIEVATALARKAKSVSDVFQAVAVADISTEKFPTYAEAVEYKNENNLADTNLILCYPKVLAEGKQYFLSTHLAALMNRVDYNNGNIPFQSPSNQALEISASILADGTEIFYNQNTANFLNSNGIGTVFAFGNGLKAWGNYTSIYPASSDPKDIWISIRRMFNFIAAQLLNNYIGNVDIPVNQRAIDSILQSSNLWLSSLTSSGAILGGRLEFDSTENTLTDLLAGRITFSLYVAPPTAAQEIIFKITFDADYYNALIS